MALSKPQIETLFAFTEKKYVRYYDLQVELVDHLANKIEDEMEVNPKTNFEDALAKVYSTFGIFGFAKIVREKEEQVRRFNNKLWFTEFKNLFVWPNLLRSIAIFLIIKVLIDLIDVEYIVAVLLVLVIIESIVKVFIKKVKEKKKKTLLITNSIYLPNLITYLNFQFLLDTWTNNFANNNLEKYKLAAVLIITLIILCYLASIKVIQKVYKTALKLYPEAFEIAK